MHSLIAVLAVSAFGIDVGWQPLEGGGVEYIIQLKPHEIEQMVNVSDLESEVPKDLDVRRYRITVGDAVLPRETPKAVTLEKESSVEVTAEKPVSDKPEIIVEATIPPAATQTTAQKPVTTATYSERDPQPNDEERYPGTSGRRDTGRVEPSRSTDRLFEDWRTSSKLDSPETEDTAPQLDPPRGRTYSNREPRMADRTGGQVDVETASFEDPDRGSRNSEANAGWLVAIFFGLLVSLCFNMWLFWIAAEARQRYQVLLEKYRSVSGKGAVDLV
jgi:hypothetical protein